MKPQEIIVELNGAGLNDAEIARELEERGTSTTQATINRLKNGVHKGTNFDLGCALLRLHKERCGKAARSRTAS